MKLLDYIRGSQKKNIRLFRQKVTARAVVWSAVAGLLIMVSVGGYFLLNEQPFTVETQPELEVLVSSVPREKEILTTESRPAVDKDSKSSIPEAILQEAYEEADREVEFDDTMAAALPVENRKNPSTSNKRRNKVAGSKSAAKGIYGRVVDKEGEPIIGAAVFIKGTQKGTTSDVDGNFSIEPVADKELEVSYIGYEHVVMPVDTTKDMLIAMNEDRQTLDEVVISKRPSRLHKIGTAIVSALKLSGAPQPEIGNKAFRQYIKENMVRPTDASCAQAKGKVILVFQVGASGRPDGIRVKKSLCPSADGEAIRLIEEGPDWTVGDKEAKVTIKFR